MTSPPSLVTLPQSLLEVQRRWLELGHEKNGRAQQDALYASEFAEPFARLFAELPLYGGPLASFERPRALVSVLGLSWQPVALMAAWVRPKRLLVLGTDDSLAVTIRGESVRQIVARVAKVSLDAIEFSVVGDPGEEDIYRAVRSFLREQGLTPREVLVDPTGGKKSMSAAATLAGFLAGAPLIYVDYGEYDRSNRIPVAGTEYPRLLTNPLTIFGDLELRDIFGAFNRSDFQQSEWLAARLAERLYEPREAECLVALSKGYGAWDRFDFKSARKALGVAQKTLGEFANRGRWEWTDPVRKMLDSNILALDDLAKIQEQPDSIENGLPLLVWYLAAAGRLLHAERPSLAVLLTYAAVERYVNLCLWIDFKLEAKSPDYALVAERLDREQYKKAGRRLFGDDYKPRDLDGPLMFSNGAQLLAALAPTRLALDSLGSLKGLSITRNKCEYEHGFLPETPPRDIVQRYLAKATAIVAGACGGNEKLELKLREFEFPKLTDH